MSSDEGTSTVASSGTTASGGKTASGGPDTTPPPAAPTLPMVRDVIKDALREILEDIPTFRALSGTVPPTDSGAGAATAPPTGTPPGGPPVSDGGKWM